MTPGRRRLQVTKMCAGLGELQVEVAKGLRVRADQWTMTLTVTPESHWHTGSRFVTVWPLTWIWHFVLGNSAETLLIARQSTKSESKHLTSSVGVFLNLCQRYLHSVHWQLMDLWIKDSYFVTVFNPKDSDPTSSKIETSYYSLWGYDCVNFEFWNVLLRFVCFTDSIVDLYEVALLLRFLLKIRFVRILDTTVCSAWPIYGNAAGQAAYK